MVLVADVTMKKSRSEIAVERTEGGREGAEGFNSQGTMEMITVSFSIW